MAHPLHEYARHVQHALERCEELEKPKYTWCLVQVQAHFEEAKKLAENGSDGTLQERRMAHLLKLIKPKARRI